MHVTVLDGGFGTMIQAAGLPPGCDPTDWNLENPAAVAAVHRAYVAAGAEIVLANTFGANRLKYRGKHDLGDLVRAAIRNARVGIGGEGAAETGNVRVALDIGPTGRLLKPAGDLDFDTAFEAFAELVRHGVAAGADLIFIETMGDIGELKAAVLAARENCSLPIYATVALDDTGHLLTGGSVECVATLLEALGVEAYGFNCGLGPDLMLPYVERLARVSTRPVIVKPNAGLPRIVTVDGVAKTVFDVGPEAFAQHVAKLVSAGASIVGGCCGTTPSHVDATARRVAAGGKRPGQTRRHVASAGSAVPSSTVSSGTSVVTLAPHAGLIIGERINPTGKKLLREAYQKGDTAYILREAVKQVEAGAAILDVNCGVPGLDEAALLASTVDVVQSVATCPLQIDTADPVALERALRRVNGKALVNSVNGKRASMDAVFPIVKRCGGLIVALCLDENGIPPTADGRLAIARRILDEGAKYGFAKRDFVFDALTLSVSADPTAAIVTLETVRRLTDEIGVNTVLGVSNVSFGLPNRPALNQAMYDLAVAAGLSAAIANPEKIGSPGEGNESLRRAAEDVLLGRDRNCANWIARETAAAPTATAAATVAVRDPNALVTAIVRGLKDDAAAAARTELATGRAPMEVVQEGIVPALERVGRGFERKTLYLPQLLMAADAAGAAFEVVRLKIGGEGVSATPSSPISTRDSSAPPTVVLATVRGDVHDIGKNIVRALLENYGFNVIDLGRDVPPERVVEAAAKNGAAFVGLSALMTTTVGAMAETIRQIKAAGLACRTIVGGAVVTQEYADSIGADFYAKDAMCTVRIAQGQKVA